MTSAAAPQVSRHQAASAAVERATRLLLACQDPAGCWPDRAVREPTMAGEGLLALDFLQVRTPAATRAAARQIRSAQRADGSWAGGEPGQAADQSASVLGYLALRLAGDPPEAYHMAAAAGWIRDAGGVEAVSATAKTWLAMFGLTGWDSVAVPAQGVSRLAAVTLAIIGTLRPARPSPIDVAELRAGEWPTGPVTRPPQSAPSLARSVVRQAGLRRYGRWLANWQQHAGSPDTGRPPWPLSLVALRALSYPVSHPALAAGLARLSEDLGRPAPNGSSLPPVAQTALAACALSSTGLPDDHPALLAAGRWLVRQRIQVAPPGPAAHAGPRPCGWSFCPDGFPRPADTACVLVALAGVDLQAVAGWPVAEDAASWLAGTQGRDGSWSGSAALTASCVQALASQPLRQEPAARAIRRGVIWLLRTQLAGGAWAGNSGHGDLLATTAALEALLAAGVLSAKPSVTGAVGWLVFQQNADGGWPAGGVGEPPGSAASDTVGTANVLPALLAAGGEDAPYVDRAAGWLIGGQRPDGSWRWLAEAAGRPLWRQPAGADESVAGSLLPLRALGRYAGPAEPRRH